MGDLVDINSRLEELSKESKLPESTLSNIFHR